MSDAESGHLSIVEMNVVGAIQSIVSETPWDQNPDGGKMELKMSTHDIQNEDNLPLSFLRRSRYC